MRIAIRQLVLRPFIVPKALGTERWLLFPLLAFSLVINLLGNGWGAPSVWHPDEIITRAIDMTNRRSLNPHFFAYGGLHHYVVAGGAVVPAYLHSRAFDRVQHADPNEAAQAQARRQGRIVVLARSISGLMSVATIAIALVIGLMLFGTATAYLSAAFLSVSMSFVAIGHFATVDAGANFWYWTSCLCALLAWKRGGRFWIQMAAVTAGFAIGTKVDRAVVLVPLMLSHLLRKENGGLRALFQPSALVLLSFAIVNPTMFLSPFEFLEGFARDNFFNLLRESTANGYLLMLDHMKGGLGLPMLATLVVGATYGLFRAKTSERLPVIWLLSTVVPYAVVAGSGFTQEWYAPFLFPALAITGAKGIVDLSRSISPHFRLGLHAAVVSVVAYSLLYTVSFVMQLTYESRDQASEWIARFVPDSASIEVLASYGPTIPGPAGRITYVRRDPQTMAFTLKGRNDLDSHQRYVAIQRFIQRAERRAGELFGFSRRERSYIAWFDHSAQFASSGVVNGSESEVSGPRADYVVVVQRLQPLRLSLLKGRDSGYQLVAEFKYRGLHPLVRPQFAFVNPTVYIFQRNGAAHRAGASEGATR